MEGTELLRGDVSRCLRSLASSADPGDAAAALQELHSLLGDGDGGRAPVEAEFRTRHYTRCLQVLVLNIRADWRLRLAPGSRARLWDGLFLRGPPDQALLVLMQALAELSPSEGLDHLVSVTEAFLCGGRLTELLSCSCVDAAPCDSPQVREALLGRICSLPDLAANRLHPLNINRPAFSPRQYYPLLAAAMLAAMERTCRALRDGTDCSLTFLAEVLGKVFLQGHGALVLSVMAPQLCASTREDMVWRRVCWRLMESVPQRGTESVLAALLQAVPGPDALGRIIGNLVLTNKKARFVLTHKVLLLQYKYETGLLRTVLGYLAADRERRPLLLQVLVSVSQAWCNSSAVKHTPVEQQLYVSQTLLLTLSLLTPQELQGLRSELLQCLLGGMQTHLDSSVPRIRRMGMVVGESLSSHVDASGTKLTFQFDEDEETRELRSLSSPEAWREAEAGNEPDSPLDAVEATPSAEDTTSSLPPTSKTDPDSDLDSDDELRPYDMSSDQELSPSTPPRYIRDCLQVLTSSEDAGRVELSLRAAEGLVRRNTFAAKEVSVQMCRVLLHMEDRYQLEGFLGLRHAAMVALTASDCQAVTRYLSAEFYSLNYSLRQRLDMLEVLAAAAQELSQPIRDQDPSTRTHSSSSGGPVTPDPDAGDWRQAVERRIQGKTKRLSKGSKLANASPNRYAPVAGHFFFPLLQNYDRPQVTFDLLGGDHLVLSRLIHTLGLFMHLALNAPIASSMGCALLDFVWTVRYHADQMVRRGVLFAVCAVFLSMPGQNLLLDLSHLLFETRTWLADVAEGDPDADCRSLAVQSLVLLDQSLKKQLQDPHNLRQETPS